MERCDEHHRHRGRGDRRPYRGQARRGRRERERRGARRAPEGDPRARPHAEGERRRDRRPRRGDRPHRRRRRRGPRRARGQGPPARADRGRRRLDPWRPRRWLLTTQNGIPWWYFFKHGGPLRGRSARERRSRRRDRQPSADRRRSSPPSATRRRRSKARASSAISRAIACRSPKSTARKTERIAALSELFTRAGFKSPVAERRAHRNLDEALGQSHLQSGERAHPCDARRHLPLSADARACGGDDAGSANRRRSVRHPLPPQRSKSASPAPRASARTRPRCCRTSSTAGRPRSTRCSARSSSSRAWPMSRPRILTRSMR